MDKSPKTIIDKTRSSKTRTNVELAEMLTMIAVIIISPSRIPIEAGVILTRVVSVPAQER